MSDLSYVDLLRSVKYNVGLLNDDERIFLNAHLKGKNLQKYSKVEARAGLRFSMLSTENEEGKNTYQDLIEKIDAWSDDVWNAIKLLYPLSLRSAYYDEELEIDIEEES